jgi:cysteine synthase A
MTARNTHWFEDNAHSIGRTPLVRLNRITDGAKATVLAKIEGRNPAYSVKCRLGAAMVWDAEKRGVLGPGVRRRRARLRSDADHA